MTPFYKLCKPDNGGAYVQTETRNGPPLTYIGDKLSDALVALYELSNSDQQKKPDDKDLNPLRLIHAFRQTLIAYLALYNQMALSGKPPFSERLTLMRKWEFTNWLSQVQRRGSVTGKSKRIYMAALPALKPGQFYIDRAIAEAPGKKREEAVVG